jgi:HAD superfamily hydrolase (TIGR01509 family)
VRARRAASFDELMASQQAMPGVEDLVHEARAAGLKLGIASSSTRAWVERFLGQVGLASLFDATCCYDDVGCAKPDPTSYLTVLRDLGVEPTEAIALEDSPNGVRAAKADLVIGSLEDISISALIGHAERHLGTR